MQRQSGVTLLELMIVVAIIGIMAAIGYPIYTDQVRKARRAEGKGAVQDVILDQERYYTTNNGYTTDLVGELGYDADPFLTDDGWYSVSAAACGGGINDCVQVTALAQGDQMNDDCGNFTLNSRGQRTATGPLGTDMCW